MSLSFDVVGIGLNATDTLILVKEFPAYAGKVPFDRELVSPGGQVATAVVACARLGLRTKYIGTIGDDVRGSIQRESLEDLNIDTSSLLVRQNCPNQTAYIIIDQRTGERTVLWQRDAGLRLLPADLREEDICHARLLHIDGYDVEAATHAAKLAHRYGIPVSLDVDTVYPGFDAVLRHVDYLIAGSSWPAKWTGLSDPFEALSALEAEYGFQVTAMTLGSRGSLALSQDRWHYSAAFEVPCLDTTGAGDVFHGAFCCALLDSMELGEALAFSNAAAALNCTAIGARGHVPTRSEIDQLLSEAKRGKVERLCADEIEEQVVRANAALALQSR